MYHITVQYVTYACVHVYIHYMYIALTQFYNGVVFFLKNVHVVHVEIMTVMTHNYDLVIVRVHFAS